MNLGVKVFIGLTVVFRFFGGPLILKLTPKTPSPTFLPTVPSGCLCTQQGSDSS